MTISGFTLVRNAIKLDYPFRESVRSALPLVDELVINCGDSEDGTRELCEELRREAPEKIRVIDSVWERKGQSGGYQLKAQTNRALDECVGPWALYLQADEVLHESDIPRIRTAVDRASRRDDVDGVVFDYLHFYANYEWVITGRQWYRREVRLFKMGRNIEAFRDAQGFRKDGRRLTALHSGAKVYHYGHVRSSHDFRQKTEEMSQWWGETPVIDEAMLRPVRHFGLKRFSGTHPTVMRERVGRNAEYIDPSRCPRRWNRDELKNLVTFAWESIFPIRLGEFRNYELVR